MKDLRICINVLWLSSMTVYFVLRLNNITHHGENVSDAEDIQPTLENMIVWLWLRLLHVDLP